MNQQYFNEFFNYIKNGTSPFHVVKESVEILEKAGFQRLEMNKTWNMEPGEKYYVVHHGSTLFAFVTGRKGFFNQQIRIAASHGDFPCPRLKTNPEMVEKTYQKLNVEMYGGAILNTWLDRPLSIAGRVALKSEEVFRPSIEYVDFRRPVATIPNLAIHINREINKGIELNRQTDMLPLCGMIPLEGNQDEKEPEGWDSQESDKSAKQQKNFFMKQLAREMQVEASDILDFELCVYNTDEPEFVGFDKEFISAPRLDNLTSSFALMKAITQCERDGGLNMAVIFDHEEIGSRTKQGAGSVLLTHVLEKNHTGLNIDRTLFIENIADSLILSVDVSHGYHPNYGEKFDPTNKPVLGGGICLKEACSQSYATDCEAIAIVQQICEKENIPYQKSVNRSDGTGGGTLGSITGALLPTNIIDIGVPLLAMHSSREMMGTGDQMAAQNLLNTFYTL